MSDDPTHGTSGGDTRTRLLNTAIELFAARGYRSTTVADIEVAAGLAPRAGTLYQHFAGKEDLLRASVDDQVARLSNVQDAMEMLPLGDLRAELLLIGRWNLADLSQRQPLYRFIEREGDQFPDIRDRVTDAVIERSLRRVAVWIEARAQAAGASEIDSEALTLVIVQSMASYRSLQSTYGRQPLGVDDDRFLRAWVEVCLGACERLGLLTPNGAEVL